MLLAFGLGFAAMPAQSHEGPSDPQIAHIAYTAGDIDIKAAEVALRTSKNDDVIAFANSMASDHKAVNDQALALMAAGPFAQLVQEAKVRRQDVVLDVGCATGYSSAVLAHLAYSVIALESDEKLSAFATAILADLGVDNVAVKRGPLEAGWPEGSPYDVILIGGSIEMVPAALTEQLAVGGRLVGVIGRGHSALGTVYTKSRSATSGRPAFNAAVRPLPGFEKPRTFVF